jgi:V/A-type H+/Na+-transporting ATPase subunit G/H
MSKAEILTQLKSAEEQAKARRAKAEEDARQTIAVARKAAAEAQRKIDASAKDIAAEANTLRAGGERSAAEMKASAKKHVGAATDYLITEFQRYVDVRAAKNG